MFFLFQFFRLRFLGLVFLGFSGFFFELYYRFRLSLFINQILKMVEISVNGELSIQGVVFEGAFYLQVGFQVVKDICIQEEYLCQGVRL